MNVLDHPFVYIVGGILVVLVFDSMIAGIVNPITSGFGLTYAVS